MSEATSTRPTTFTAKAFAAQSATSALAAHTIERRAPQPDDVQIEILFCGVCHSDLHTVRDEWNQIMQTVYPCVPGHEIIGRVVKVGSNVTKFKVGEMAGVGCLVDSCGSCECCRENQEQFCTVAPIFTYNGPDKALGGITYGGYSDSIVVKQDFVLHIPDALDPAAAAPLLCAGITTYSPLRHWKAGPGQKVGIVGLGGLGHMAVKFARAFGAHVVLFTTSESKKADGLRLGAHEVVVSTNPAEMAAHMGSFDFILDAVSAQHDLNAYVGLLKREATLTLLGAPEVPAPTPVFSLLFGRKRLAGSLIGGIRETQEMLDFCATHGITSEIELIPMQQIEAAYARMIKGDVKYRFVIDMASLKN